MKPPRRRWLALLPRGERVLRPLLVAIALYLFVAVPLADLGVLAGPLVSMALVLVVLAAILGLCSSRRGIGAAARGGLAVAAIGLGALVLAAQLLGDGPEVVLALDVAAALFLAALSLLLLRGIFAPGAITVRRIKGAVAVYLLVVLLFAVLFDLTESLVPGAFATGPLPMTQASANSRFLYMSMITVTSTGFGDMTPVHPVARSLVMAAAAFGQIYTTVVLGWLVSLGIGARRSGPR
jgi:hypothetical protein